MKTFTPSRDSKPGFPACRADAFPAELSGKHEFKSQLGMNVAKYKHYGTTGFACATHEVNKIVN